MKWKNKEREEKEKMKTDSEAREKEEEKEVIRMREQGRWIKQDQKKGKPKKKSVGKREGEN